MYSDFESAVGLSIAIVGIWIVAMLLIVGWGIARYVMQSLSYYTIAKRRDLKNPWMAWAPVLNSWLLGSISDQYQYVVHGKVKNKRKWLLGLMIAYLVAYILFEVGVIAMSFRAVIGYEVVGSTILMVLAGLLMFGLLIAMTVVQYIALSDLYRSCDPGHATLYLVLSIIVGVTMPFFLLACRKKDLGMPPRRSTIVDTPPHLPEQTAVEAEPVPAEEALDDLTDGEAADMEGEV